MEAEKQRAYNRYQEQVFDAIAEACGKCDLSVSRDNRIDFRPNADAVENATREVMLAMGEFSQEFFYDTCHTFGLRPLCEHCDERFICWTER